MATGLSKVGSLGVGNKAGSLIGRIMGSLWEVTSIVSYISFTHVVTTDSGLPINDLEARKQDKMREEWGRARRILHWCESRTRKLVLLGAVLTTVSVIIRIILRIAKLAARFSPPAAADFATTYYKAQDILKRATTTSAMITFTAAMINRMCSARLDNLMAVQDRADAYGDVDYGQYDPDPFFNFDETEFEARLREIEREIDDLNRTRAPQTQSECDLVFQKLDAINTLDAIVVDITGLTSDPFIMAQYAGANDVLDSLKAKIRRIRADISPPESTNDSRTGVGSLFVTPTVVDEDTGFTKTSGTDFIKESGT